MFFICFHRCSAEERRFAQALVRLSLANKSFLYVLYRFLYVLKGILNGMYTVFIVFQKKMSPPPLPVKIQNFKVKKVCFPPFKLIFKWIFNRLLSEV